MHEQLEYFFNTLTALTKIPFRIWDTDVNEWIWNCDQEEQHFICDRSKLTEIITKYNEQATPFLYEEQKVFFTGICKCSESLFAIIGPIVISEPTSKEKNQYKRKHQINIEVSDMKFSIKSLTYLANAVGLIYHYYSGKSLSCYEILRNSSESVTIEKIAVENTRNFISDVDLKKENLSYYYTQLIKKLISNGDYEEIKRLANTMNDDYIGEFTTSAFKRVEYMAVNAANLSAQAAVEGGLSSSIAYNLSDMYCRRIEACQTVVELLKLISEMQKDYTNRVKECKEQRKDSSYVEKCKVFIIKHLNQPISLENIATYLQLDRCYLSRIFYKKEGIHLLEFIHIERIKAASNILKYSDVPLSLIASYFCFGSQSHFGAVFKKYQGLTPKQFRDQYQILDYISDVKDHIK